MGRFAAPTCWVSPKIQGDFKGFEVHLLTHQASQTELLTSVHLGFLIWRAACTLCLSQSLSSPGKGLHAAGIRVHPSS